MTTTMTLENLVAALERRLTGEAATWLAEARGKVSRDPAAIHVLSPQAGRRCGRGSLEELGGGWTVDDAARALLIAELPLTGAALAAAIEGLYWDGDAVEKRSVLRALSVLDSSVFEPPGPGPAAAAPAEGFLAVLKDALRTNDTRLIAAALGPYGAAHLDAAAYRQGVLKCLFTGIPLADISGTDRRVDDELIRMIREFADERIAAGRSVPDDVWKFVPPAEA